MHLHYAIQWRVPVGYWCSVKRIPPSMAILSTCTYLNMVKSSTYTQVPCADRKWPTEKMTSARFGLGRKHLTTSLASNGHTTFATCVSTTVKEENVEERYACAFGQDLWTAVSVIQHRAWMENVNTTITSKRQQLPLSSLETWTSPVAKQGPDRWSFLLFWQIISMPL